MICPDPPCDGSCDEVTARKTATDPADERMREIADQRIEDFVADLTGRAEQEHIRSVMTNTIAEARIRGDGPWATADALMQALDREGYTVAARASQEPAHWPVVARLRSGEWGVHCLACSTAAGDYVPRCLETPDDWPPLVLQAAPHSQLMEARAQMYAARASQAITEETLDEIYQACRGRAYEPDERETTPTSEPHDHHEANKAPCGTTDQPAPDRPSTAESALPDAPSGWPTATFVYDIVDRIASDLEGRPSAEAVERTRGEDR